MWFKLVKEKRNEFYQWNILWLEFLKNKLNIFYLRVLLLFKFLQAHLIKNFLLGVVLLCALLGVGIIGCHLWVKFQTQERIYSDIDAIPAKKVALLLGTVKRLRNGYINLYFQYRIDAAVQLYQAGKITHIIASGANHTQYYNEPKDMKQALVAQGIPKHAITLDYAGFRTLDSVVRCKKIFSQSDIIIISQAFHNQRAIFISDYYNIKAIGFNAKDVPFYIDMKTSIREYLARFKAFLDLYVLKTQPRFLGDKVNIHFIPPTPPLT